MIVGVISWQLSIPGATSLKAKRSVVKSLKERIRNRFNVSIAETDHHDIHSRAELSAAVLARSTAEVDSIMESLDRFLERDGRAVIVGTDRSFLG